MNIREIISALALCASNFDDNKDRLLLPKNIHDIKVHDGYVTVYFTDGNKLSIEVGGEAK